MAMTGKRGQGARRPHGWPCNDEQRRPRLSGAPAATRTWWDRRLVTDPRKIAEIHALTRPSAQAGNGSPVPDEEWDDRSLVLGSRVGEFEITGIIGKGGFGIVYLAWDHSLERVVALKEYMPASFATRKNRTQVSPLSERHRETFQVGLNSFVNEAKLLAQFHSPSLVEVHRFWEANGTAYMVMPYYRGKTLGETIRAFSGPPGEAWLLDLLAPLTEALMELHSVQCYHRDIAPDNILILDDTGSPLLLDFGAARRVIAGQAHALTIILKAGYAPVEQYGAIPGMEQGPWTDVYALASVVYWAVTGNTPPAATSRMIRDTYVPLAECAPPQYSRAFAAAIDRALAVLPDARTQTIDALRSELGLGPSAVRRTAAPFRWSDSDATVVMVPRTGSNEAVQPAQAGGSPGERDLLAPPPSTYAAPPAPRLRRFPLAAGPGAVALLLAVAGGVWLMRSGDDAAPPPDLASTRSGKLPLPSPVPAQALPEPAPAPAETIPVPHSAADALALILARKDPALRIGVDVKGRRQGGVPRSVAYTSSEPGHLYLIGVQAGNDEPLRLLLPGPGSAPVRIHTSGKLDLPANALKPGRWKFALVVARQAVDPAAYGWIIEDKAWTRRFAENSSPDISAQLPWAIRACVAGVPACESAYGAAGFDLDIEAPPLEAAKPAPAQPASPNREPERATRPPHSDAGVSAAKSAKAAPNPECEKILVRMSLGEASQELIDRMKTLKCN
jgi:serine/threonine protein kinase